MAVTGFWRKCVCVCVGEGERPAYYTDLPMAFRVVCEDHKYYDMFMSVWRRHGNQCSVKGHVINR